MTKVKEGTFTTSDNYPNPISDEERSAISPKFPDKLPLDSAEDIANVVDDLKKGRVHFLSKQKNLSVQFHERVKGVKDIIDATVVYNGLIDEQRLGKAIYYYEDHPCIAPPFEHVLVAYQNGHGNIIAMDCLARETDRTQQWKVVKQMDQDPDAAVDWSRVRWAIDVIVWGGGQTNDGRRNGTYGPAHMWQLAVYEDGEPADIRWVNINPQYPMESWDMAMATLLGSLNFMACRNVEIVEPKRTRSEARRIQRTGVTVSVINVFPIGKTSRSRGSSESTEGSVPLTSVRGHFAHYGEQYGRKLLFGKYAGKFWIPAYARGSEEAGETEKTYKLRPDVEPHDS